MKTARPAAAFFCGLGGAVLADYARILWADAILQTEIDLAAGKVHVLKQVQRWLHAMW